MFASKADKAVGLVDADRAGKDTRGRLPKRVQESSLVKLLQLKMPVHLIDVAKVLGGFPVGLEETFTPEIWDHAETTGWLEERPNLLRVFKHDDPTVSFEDRLTKSGLDAHQLRYVRNRVRKESKVDLAKYVSGLSGSALERCTETLGKVLDNVMEFLDG